MDLEENKMNILRYVYEDDRSTMLHIFREAYEKTATGAEGKSDV